MTVQVSTGGLPWTAASNTTTITEILSGPTLTRGCARYRRRNGVWINDWCSDPVTHLGIRTNLVRPCGCPLTAFVYYCDRHAIHVQQFGPGTLLNCVHCGHRYPQTSPTWFDQMLRLP